MDITKPTDLLPASFECPPVKLSKSQRAIIALIKKRIEDESFVSLDDILNLYFIYNNRGGMLYDDRCWSGRTPRHEYSKNDWKNNTYLKGRAKKWFESNLGTCIIRGKFLIIPVIEL